MNAASPSLLNIFTAAAGLLLLGGLPVGIGIFGSFLKPTSRRWVERSILKPGLMLLWVALVVFEVWRHHWWVAVIFLVGGMVQWVLVPRFLQKKRSQLTVESVGGIGKAL